MMIKPPMTDLENKVDSKYTLVTLAAKRAREIIRMQKSVESVEIIEEVRKPVSVAMEEIAKGEVTYIRTKEGIK